MKKEVDIEQIKKDTIEVFQSGFACSESVIYGIRKGLELDIPDSAIAMSSGFPWGLGDGGCICGALAGGTMCLGFVFGRTVPGDERFLDCQKFTKELHDHFKKSFGATCCRVLTKDYEKFSPERKQHCVRMVENIVEKTVEIILRESNKEE